MLCAIEISSEPFPACLLWDLHNRSEKWVTRGAKISYTTADVHGIYWPVLTAFCSMPICTYFNLVFKKIRERCPNRRNNKKGYAWIPSNPNFRLRNLLSSFLVEIEKFILDM